jgi:hypothetical protein
MTRHTSRFKVFFDSVMLPPRTVLNTHNSSARHNLRDVTFIIPIFLDTPERARNLQSNIAFLDSLFETQILVGEKIAPDSAPCAFLQEYSRHNASLQHFPHAPGRSRDVFHRTRMLNILMSKVQTPFVCNLDCDAVFAVSQYLNAVGLLRTGETDFVFPYIKPYVSIPQNAQNEVLEILKTRPLDESEIERLSDFASNHHSLGGAIFGVTEIYRACGGENEGFIGWGLEDNERVVRFEKLGRRISRTPGCFHHLSHPRGPTSSKQHKHYHANRLQYKLIKTLPRKALEFKISRWKWTR